MQGQAGAGVVTGIGDDCAVLEVPEGQQLVVSIDTLVEGVHFLPDTAPEQLAERLLGAAVSDLAAMAAVPGWLTLALTLPHRHWLPIRGCNPTRFLSATVPMKYWHSCSDW